MTKRWIARLLFALSLTGSAVAADFPLSSVPEPLKSWVPWVLDGAPEAGCPHLFNNPEQRHCAWAGTLELKAGARGASFAQDWTAYRDTWIRLPGNDKHWPQEVSVDGKTVAVLSREGLPAIKLAAGAHRVAGSFVWSELPESLALPESAGLLRLELNGQNVALPVRDESNQLWLQSKVDAEGAEDAQVRVYRKVVDGIPLSVETLVQLEVSGKSREISIGRALLAEMIPQGLVSPLPATLTQDGSLKVQARAGTWEIRFVARGFGHNSGPVKALALPAEHGLFAAEEVWVFQAAPLIRSASIEGATAVDPQQTTLPNEWRSLPSYLMRADTQFGLKEIRRGDSEPAPDKLTLDRRLWLSFDGRTMTVSDRIQGEISRASRLSMNAPAQLGRADVDGQDQLVTRGSDNLAGIEVKRGRLAMTADSLLPAVVSNSPRALSAVGWMHDFDRVSTELALPAGWRLLHAAGADRADGAWLAQWNLLDFFLVLVIALAAGQLWGYGWGLVALLALVLSYQEPGAPTWEWLVVLAAVALHRVLPVGRFKNGMQWIQRASLLVLVLVTLGFATDQVRSALYPVLEHGAYASFGEAPVPVAAPAPMPAQEMAADAAGMAEELAMDSEAERKAERPSSAALGKMMSRSPPPKKAQSYQRQRAYQMMDPDAKVQTGPGLPDWRWHSYRLSWDGPVRQDQPLDLWLLSPSANKALVVARLLLLGLLLACVAGVSARFGRGRSGGGSGRFAKPIGMLLIAAVAAGSALHSPSAQAALPDQQRLDELREKITRPADCLPECADISRLSVQLQGSGLRLGLDVEAAIDTALPLPGGAKHWLPNEARLDGKIAYVQRDAGGSLWLLIPAGRHRVEFNGEMLARDVVQLPLPRKPRRVDVIAEGWDVAGLSDEANESNSAGVADTLQLTRRVKAAGSTEAPSLPPFLRVERRLILDLVWRVETTVRRDSPLGVPALAQIPLLPGESVTSSGISVKDGKVLVNLGPQADSLSWSSSLAQTAELKLAAPNTSDWVESWTIAASALWHLTADGIPPVAADANDDADLAFRPWPGETLALKVERPQAIAGQTLTIDSSSVLITPGTRATDHQLRVSVRSSRGVDHTLTLPEGASLQRVSVNGQPRPIRASGRQLILPLTPGKQVIEVVWRVDQGMALSYASLPVGLGQTSVNSRTELHVPQDRWLLLASGPGIGPAILFWGKLLVLIAVAVVLGRIGQSNGLPMRRWQWVILALGLTQVDWWAAALVVVWFFAFALRSKAASETNRRWLFNLRQLSLVALTLALFGVLFAVVEGGLLGQPDMQVIGNNSRYGQLNWYLDRAAAELQGAWILSLPILVYRGLMLLWALWLAWSLLAWLKWGWNAFGQGDLWRRKAKLVAPTDVQTPNDASSTQG